MSDTKQMSAVDAAILTIQGLPPERQLEIADQILDSVDDPQDELDEATIAEIDRRSEEVARGEGVLIPGDEALRLLRDRKKVLHTVSGQKRELG